MNVDGEIIRDQEGIKLNFVKFYESLYKSPKIRNEDIESYLERVSIPDIIERMGEELKKEFEEEEIVDALKSTSREKAPGPDGYTSLFYKKIKRGGWRGGGGALRNNMAA